MSVPDTLPDPATAAPATSAGTSQATSPATSPAISAGVTPSAQSTSVAHEAPPARRRLRVLLPLITLPIVAYSLACLIYNAPASAARVRLIDPIVRLMPSYFGQDWQLFAPTPPTDNDLLYMDVELRPAGSNQVLKTPQVEIERAIDRLPRSDRVNPTKLPGVMLGMQEDASRYARQATEIKKDLPKDEQDAAMNALTRRFQPNFEEMRRFLSARAASMYPHDHIIAVRGTFKNQPIVPFSRRYQKPSPHQATTSLLQTSWMAFVPGVAQ